MPYEKVRDHPDCASGQVAVVKSDNGQMMGCHDSDTAASEQIAALHASEAGARSQLYYRSYQPDLEVRSGGDGRTIYGIAVPYGQPKEINSQLTEQWARGAFNHQLRVPNRVKFSREHLILGGTLIGATRMLRDDAAGLYGEWRASKTPAGDETLELVRDGALSELSIMFSQPKSRRLRGGTIERTRANLSEVAVVLQGAFGELAAAAGVRSAGDETGEGTAPRLEEAYRLLDQLPELALPPA